MKRLLAFVLATVALSAPAFADNGAQNYAITLHNTRVFRHDPGYRGPEVIFVNAGGNATPEQAMAAWQNSPPHRALLPQIRFIRCYGNYCVGR